MSVMSKTLELHVNGRSHRVSVDPDRSLLSVLREELGLTGSKYGCGEGQCGACTVLIAGTPTRSCITPVGSVDRRPVTTIEGLEKNGHLHPVQEAFMELDALQCGYCTPGMIMSGVGLLNSRPDPTDAEIIHAMQGNVCRCGAYPRIAAAIRQAVDQTRGQKRVDRRVPTAAAARGDRE